MVRKEMKMEASHASFTRELELHPPRPLFHKVSVDRVQLNHLGAFLKRYILRSRYPS